MKYIAVAACLGCLIANDAGRTSEGRADPHDEAGTVKRTALARFDNRYTVALCQRQLPVLTRGGKMFPGTLFWLEVEDAADSTSRAVWKHYHWGGLPEAWTPRDFVVARKKGAQLGLVFIDGPNITFREVHLNDRFQVAPEVVREEARNQSIAIISANLSTNIPYVALLREIGIDVLREKRVRYKPPKIEALAWKEKQWEVLVSLGSTNVVFVRRGDEGKWRVK